MTSLHLLLLLSTLTALSLAWVPQRSFTSRNANPLRAVKTDEELLPAVREGVAEKDALDEWNSCVEFLAGDIGVDHLQAEILLAAALEWRGWARVTSALARKYMKPKTPDLQQLQTALSWLREGPLALTDSAILKEAIEKSPTAYLVDPAAAYAEALDTAPAKYKDADAFQALLMEDPSVLECSYNCVDDGCASECGNCWVSYEIKKGGQKVEF